MVHYTKVLSGVAAYIDRELISQMGGSVKGWIAGAAAALMLERGKQAALAAMRTPALKELGIVDGENVDVDAIYSALLKQAQKGSATATLPLIGPVTFKESDVEALYRYIMEQG